ncbi:hypothetical protein [Streptomyces exfoliatus]|uniref:hypothetical protein n=1 Tax=Streptomyces exfoliatus TaxID=1905 RepID=UPI0004654508|nr:hypothetical protein [Streptomyces exfoliatus]
MATIRSFVPDDDFHRYMRRSAQAMARLAGLTDNLPRSHSSFLRDDSYMGPFLGEMRRTLQMMETIKPPLPVRPEWSKNAISRFTRCLEDVDVPESADEADGDFTVRFNFGTQESAEPAQVLGDEITRTFCHLTGALDPPEGVDAAEWTLRCYDRAFRVAEYAVALWEELVSESDE